jgi:hypothetical protein
MELYHLSLQGCNGKAFLSKRKCMGSLTRAKLF